MGLLHSIATQWPNPSLFLEHSPQLSAKSPLCIGEWNMQQFNMDFTCHAILSAHLQPEFGSEDVRRFQLAKSGAKHVILYMCFWILWFLLLDVIRVNHREFSQRNHVYIYIYVSECLTFGQQKTVLHWLWALPSLGSCACDIHRMGRFWPWGRGVVLLHMYCIWCHLNQEGVGMKITYLKKTKPHARMRIWYSILSYSATTGLSATFFASFFQPIQIQ